MSDLSQTPFLDSKARPVRAPQGTQLSCANWQIEAAYRMIQNNLDPAVAEQGRATWMYEVYRGLIHRAWVLNGRPAAVP